MSRTIWLSNNAPIKNPLREHMFFTSFDYLAVRSLTLWRSQPKQHFDRRHSESALSIPQRDGFLLLISSIKNVHTPHRMHLGDLPTNIEVPGQVLFPVKAVMALIAPAMVITRHDFAHDTALSESHPARASAVRLSALWRTPASNRLSPF